MATIYRNGVPREVPDSQVDYLTGKKASGTTGQYIPNPYSMESKISSNPVSMNKYQNTSSGGLNNNQLKEAFGLNPKNNEFYSAMKERGLLDSYYNQPKTPSSTSTDFSNEMTNFLSQQKSDYDSFNLQTEEDKARQREQERLAQMRAVINRQANQQRGIATEIGKKKEEGYKVGLGISEGLNWSSLGTDAIADLGRETQAELAKINEAESIALADADTNSIDKLSQELTKLRALKAEKEKNLIDIWKELTSRQESTQSDNLTEYNFYADQERQAGREPLSYLEWKLKLGGKTEDNAPLEVSPGASLYDPKTGKFIGTAPNVEKPVATNIQTVKTANGVYAYDSNDPEMKMVRVGDSETDSDVKIVKINGEDYVQNSDGTFSKPEVPTAPTADKVAKADDVVNKIDSILDNADLSKAIGPVSANLPSWWSGARNAVLADVNSLIASIAIENLSLLKGPMSDKDIQFIKEASSGLNTNMSEQAFKDRLMKLRNKFEEIKNKAQMETSGTSDFSW